MLARIVTSLMIAGSLAGCTSLSQNSHSVSSDEIASNSSGVCEGFGPQTPRDIANIAGENEVFFPIAPPAQQMNLCNIHFHNPAEHKAPAFSVIKPGDEHGKAGYQCKISSQLTDYELMPYEDNQCKGVKPGDTIEVHWVHSSCDVEPGPGLGSCLSESCANPSLRVETQVFTVVNDPDALDFSAFTPVNKQIAGMQQAKTLPSGTGTPVEFLGSTTGPSYSEQVCSPLQVTWSVRPQCAKLDIRSLSNWCASNVFNEDHAHGVRNLVTNPKLLAPIQ